MEEEIMEEEIKKENRIYLKGVVTGILLAVIAVLCVLIFRCFQGEDEEDSASGYTLPEGVFTSEEAEKIQTIMSYINTYSYFSQDEDEMMDGIYSALIDALDDDYAVYYDRETYAKLVQSSQGSYSGIGCAVIKNSETGEILVLYSYDDSPAAEAGMTAGDVLLKADDTELTGMDLSEAVSYIKGEEGSEVTLTWLHGGEEKTAVLTRRSIEIPTVEYEMLEDNIGYIEISEFDEVTVTQFEEALNELIDEGAEGLIFDVRSNPGGLYSSVVSMLDTLLPEGTLVYTEDKYGNRQTETSDADCIELPMAVLINENSASASEIFAGALKDYGWAKIIGTQSFGKGIVQSVVPLGDGTAIKFTVSSYFTPSGVCIHGIGIEPDIEVELPEDDDSYDEYGYLKEGCDTQLNAAVEYLTACEASE